MSETQVSERPGSPTKILNPSSDTSIVPRRRRLNKAIDSVLEVVDEREVVEK
jgi:hypothetical protein